MHFVSRIRWIVPLVVCLGTIFPLEVQATWFTQTIPLKAGWNAVHVRVNPFEYGCDGVFGGGGIDQVSWWSRDQLDDGKGAATAEMFAWYATPLAPHSSFIIHH